MPYKDKLVVEWNKMALEGYLCTIASSAKQFLPTVTLNSPAFPKRPGILTSFLKAVTILFPSKMLGKYILSHHQIL
ncbi:MAG: hypothetical protein D6E12_04490 [Desulfovibrio sp.]|nr:MAG: hypothetical protein D6E12_04490 [Desulfovibrio sp.]